MRTRLVLLALAAAALAVLAVGTGSSAVPGRASSTGIAVIVRVPGQADQTLGVLAAPPNGRTSLGPATVGGAVSIAGGSVAVQTGPGAAPRSEAVVELQGVSLFGGEVTVDRVVARAASTSSGGAAEGDFAGSTLEGLTVLGGPLGVVENARAGLGGLGQAVTLEQAVVPGDDQGPGWRGFVTALHVTLTRDHGGLPAGSEILIGYAEAASRPDRATQPPAETEEVPADTGGQPEDGGAPGAGGGSQGDGSGQAGGRPSAPPAPDDRGGPPPIVRDPPPDVRPSITGDGFVFPVWGSASFSDDFAAPRADTIWHHGNDIFAPLGSPVLAVTDGELFLVGWNRLGGHRLWLRDGEGNEYYYAHLAAYSPLAANGARVRAGDVLGFVGISGVAGGVPHLHFEVHPHALLGLGYDGAINPYPYLLAWQESQDRDFDVVLPAAARPAPKPGAVILGGVDISTSSGLDREAVERSLERAAAALTATGTAAPRPPLVGAPPGFPSG